VTTREMLPRFQKDTITIDREVATVTLPTLLGSFGETHTLEISLQSILESFCPATA